MLRTSPTLTAVLLACTRIVSADFDEFFFASNATEYVCPGIGFACTPPMICSHESVTDLYYCCAPGAIDAVCWKGSASCDGGDEKTPSGSQQSCSSGDNAFCCLKSREECTQTKNQINVCWSTIDNPVANLSDTKLNETFSSLSSAKPSASSFPISLAQLQASATPTTSLPVSMSASSLSSGSAIIPASTAASVTSIVTDLPEAQPIDKKGKPGGAIGGIVGGVVGGLVLISIAGFLLFRRRKANLKGGHAPIAPGPPPYKDAPEAQGSPVGGHHIHEMQGGAPAEMDASAYRRV
ncbi:uncharacterized protein M421DRAFT_393067 [Didymella exigua CBS 183.55]|uniref:Mid2 domain-containing protein n=1 Tax=Didymella exigua CBS 183.55 TaxID=1150837 RepID=A0A6A5RPY2_9PLEO|nr:uncharacterized protein M421DRAFT_393067 [Didymella exigua CBS 183.55]KAF1927547.1 hypothetical protein M421DRAFT_393067 [Didymella exigua CBS 183.55]